jgi:AbrB family looped-hinge helix DNA binding protein
MRTTIDKSGRVVIPRQLRDAIGLVPGEVELVVDGGGIRIEPASGSGFVERDGRLVIDAEIELDDDDVRAMRLGTQK